MPDLGPQRIGAKRLRGMEAKSTVAPPKRGRGTSRIARAPSTTCSTLVARSGGTTPASTIPGRKVVHSQNSPAGYPRQLWPIMRGSGLTRKRICSSAGAATSTSRSISRHLKSRGPGSSISPLLASGWVSPIAG